MVWRRGLQIFNWRLLLWSIQRRKKARIRKDDFREWRYLWGHVAGWAETWQRKVLLEEWNSFRRSFLAGQTIRRRSCFLPQWFTSWKLLAYRCSRRIISFLRLWRTSGEAVSLNFVIFLILSWINSSLIMVWHALLYTNSNLLHFYQKLNDYIKQKANEILLQETNSLLFHNKACLLFVRLRVQTLSQQLFVLLTNHPVLIT